MFVYLVVCGVIGQNVNNGLRGLPNTQRARLMPIPDGVVELCEKGFCVCESLLRVTFDDSSSLKLIGKEVFNGSGVVEIHIPDVIERLVRDRSADMTPSPFFFGQVRTSEVPDP